MSDISVNDNTTWRVATAGIAVNDGGVWRDIRQISVNDNGTWRDVFNVWYPQQVVGGNAGPGISVDFLTNGAGISTGNGSTGFNWFYPSTTSIGNGYWIYGQVLQGTVPTPTMGVWHPLSSPVSFVTFTAGFNIVRVSIATDDAGANIVNTSDLHLIII